MDIDEDITVTVPDEVESENITSLSLLPKKSRNLYEKSYTEFISWCKGKQISRYSESELLAYFSDISAKGLIGSLWPKYSMLKATLNLKKNIDISKFNELIKFIKSQKEGYMPKKSKVLEKEQVQRFITDAPNRDFLMTKIALIFGVTGAMRKNELLKLEKDDVEDFGSKFLITIRASRTKTNRIFTIVDNEQQNFLKLIRHYISLRPAHTPHKRFFIFYKNNKCSTQPVGINSFSILPSRIAAFLKLEQPHLYTGHCLRRSSASILSDTGTDVPTIKLEADGCMETLVQNEVEKVPHTSSDSVETHSTTNIGDNEINLTLNSECHTIDNLSSPRFNFSNCTVANLNIHIHKHNAD